MNKSGQMLIYGIMMLILALIFATIVTRPMIEVIDIARDSDHLDCSNNSISTGQKATCLVFDIYLPYFVITILFLGGSYITYKKITE
jgi:hypothetical protein